MFDDFARRILDGPNLAVVATLMDDGSPHTSTVWFVRDGDHILFSVTADKVKARNLTRDPRVSVTVFDLANPYQSVDVRGTAELIEDPDKSLAKTLSQRYLGQDPAPEPEEVKRFVARVVPRRVTRFGA